MTKTLCFNLFSQCVKAMHDGKLIVPVSAKDKEFHFQNWCQSRLDETNENYETGGRNSYPDFRIVRYQEGYEIKGLAYPGRERDFDANSNLPTGFHNGRQIFYIFGRYPSDLSEYKTGNSTEYPVIDFVMCHGDFLSANHDYEHQNKHVSGFGTYGDIMIRDRKMYVVPTPFALTEGTTGLATLIIPEDYEIPKEFICVGDLVRVESSKLVVSYTFDLANNKMLTEEINNPSAGELHKFKAYRLNEQSSKIVKMRNRTNVRNI